MAVKIRLMRVGKKKQPTYRVVVADGRSPRDGRFIEILGQYEPRNEPSVVKIDAEKALSWIEQGAQPTEQAAKILDIAGVWDTYQTKHGKAAAARPKAKQPRPKAAAAAEATAPGAPVPAAPAPAAPRRPPMRRRRPHDARPGRVRR